MMRITVLLVVYSGQVNKSLVIVSIWKIFHPFIPQHYWLLDSDQSEGQQCWLEFKSQVCGQECATPVHTGSSLRNNQTVRICRKPEMSITACDYISMSVNRTLLHRDGPSMTEVCTETPGGKFPFTGWLNISLRSLNLKHCHHIRPLLHTRLGVEVQQHEIITSLRRS